MGNVADRGQNGRDDDDAPHIPGAVQDPNAYWRRRFFILGGGVVVLGLCAWLFPGAHHAAPRASATARASTAALARRGNLPPAADGSAGPGSTPKNTAKASVTASASHRKTGVRAHPGASPSPGPTPATRTPATRTPAAPTAAAPGGPRCTPSDIVLSLFTGQPSYGRTALPEFDIYAVSTSSRACTLSFGPGSVQVVVTRRGRVVWDSAACKLPAATPARFTRGVPQVLTITWNRRAGQPSGCAGSLPAGAWGTFDAVALTDGQSSPVRSFKLSG
jgi:hypothetical protein